MKNIDYIKSLDVEDMADIIQLNADYKCDFCKGYACDKVPDYSEKCTDGIMQWLNEERKDE